MISICIPVLNTNVNGLVKSLVNEIEQRSITCEIIVLDDGSDKRWQEINEEITKLAFVNYHQLPVNKGRIEARRKLAALSRYEWLLFIDADSKIIKDNFLTTYLNYCITSHDVIVGGRIYNNKPPQHCNQILHWKYGCKREKFSMGRFNFMTNNFCIRKSIFTKIEFPNALKGYGHEDTWMGIQLKQNTVRTVQIKNPALHEGVEKAEIFIGKSKNALLNLWLLQQQVPAHTLQQHVKLFKYYTLQKKLGLSSFIQWIESKFHFQIEKNLSSCQPSLILFDFYRLAYFIYLERNPPLRKD